MHKNQVGQFDVSRELVYGNPDLVARIFAEMKLVVLTAEVYYPNDSIRYVAMSDRFKRLNGFFGDYPRYTIGASEEDGVFKVSVKELT